VSNTVEFDDNGPSMTIDAFCLAESLSKGFYFHMQKLGVGPQTYVIPGTRTLRITAKARREWHARMMEMSQQASVKRERERRRELARVAGLKSVQSPHHVNVQRRARMIDKINKKFESAS
jgi:hypothetical protein